MSLGGEQLQRLVKDPYSSNVSQLKRSRVGAPGELQP